MHFSYGDAVDYVPPEHSRRCETTSQRYQTELALLKLTNKVFLSTASY